MSEETGVLSNAAAWGAFLSAAFAAGFSYMGYQGRKRDDAIMELAKSMTALELAIEKNKTFNAESYATKPTVLALFQQATVDTKDAVARVEKRIDETNSSVSKVDVKLDKVVDTLGSFQTIVMTELAKKT